LISRVSYSFNVRFCPNQSIQKLILKYGWITMSSTNKNACTISSIQSTNASTSGNVNTFATTNAYTNRDFQDTNISYIKDIITTNQEIRGEQNMKMILFCFNCNHVCWQLFYLWCLKTFIMFLTLTILNVVKFGMFHINWLARFIIFLHNTDN